MTGCQVEVSYLIVSSVTSGHCYIVCITFRPPPFLFEFRWKCVIVRQTNRYIQLVIAETLRLTTVTVENLQFYSTVESGF